MARQSGVLTDKVVRFNSEIMQKAVKDSGITMNKLSRLVINRDATYVSKALTDGKCNKDDLRKLCEFLDVNYDEVIMLDESTTVKPVVGNDANIDLLIAGLNRLCEIEKANGEKLDNILTAIEATNAKTNRLENALGQIVGNVIEIKNTENANNGILKDLKSTGAVVSGRLRDMVGKFK